MNILVIAPDFKPLLGGIAEYTHQLIYHWHYGGDKIAVLAPYVRGNRAFDRRCPYTIRRYRRYRGKWGFLGRYWQEYHLVRWAIQEHSPDIVIANVLGSEAVIAGLMAKGKTRKFVIFTYGRELGKRGGIIWALKRWLILKLADKALALSPFGKDLLIDLGYPAERIVIVPPGVNRKDFEGNKNKEQGLRRRYSLRNKKIIFTLGRLVKRKGIDTLIKALPLVIKRVPNTVCLIGGKGPDREELEKLAKKSGVGRQVIFLGRVKENEKRYFYKMSDVFVMPCRREKGGDVEGFGIVFLEAGAAGRPVIAGNSGGAKYAVRDGETGFLVDPHRVDELAKKIVLLLQNETWRKKMGQKGYLWARKFDWETIASLARRALRHSYHL